MTSMSLPEHIAETARDGHCLFRCQMLNNNRKVLRQQLTDEDGATQNTASQHASAQIWRKVPGVLDDASAVVPRHYPFHRNGGAVGLFGLEEGLRQTIHQRFASDI